MSVAAKQQGFVLIKQRLEISVPHPQLLPADPVLQRVEGVGLARLTDSRRRGGLDVVAGVAFVDDALEGLGGALDLLGSDSGARMKIVLEH